eukprot:1202259-Amphidinium_carterae.1
MKALKNITGKRPAFVKELLKVFEDVQPQVPSEHHKLALTKSTAILRIILSESDSRQDVREVASTPAMHGSDVEKSS